MDNPNFPPVRLLYPPDDRLQDNFQYVPPEPLTAPRGGGFMRSSSFPQVAPLPAATPAKPTSVNDPHHYINAITGNAADAATLVAQLIIPRNDLRRNVLGFRNTIGAGGSNILIDFGKAPNAQSWLLIAPQQIVFFDEGVMQDDVWVTGDAFPWAVAFIYSTIPNNV